MKNYMVQFQNPLQCFNMTVVGVYEELVFAAVMLLTPDVFWWFKGCFIIYETSTFIFPRGDVPLNSLVVLRIFTAVMHIISGMVMWYGNWWGVILANIIHAYWNFQLAFIIAPWITKNNIGLTPPLLNTPELATIMAKWGTKIMSWLTYAPFVAMLLGYHTMEMIWISLLSVVMLGTLLWLHGLTREYLMSIGFWR